ncbi:STAS/SEC14 domain-containing protein [Thalassomonas sp. RHCl1]|uniref:STAS/SEC14 domain-containing protein n=1 Tax=Thalassomonas sp. RHCl1 TaxID=2995320 RepID=UPI00248CFB18|nr:STAS/SEC14 domain-containing protein [Thalassomonas sp. RHCl1]
MNEHGYFKLAHSKNVIFLWLKGPGNKETFDRYNAGLNKLLEKKEHKKYAILVMLEGENIMTPEVFTSFQKSLASRIALGLKTIAFVIKESDYIAITRQQINKLYQGSPDFNVQFFDSFDDAKQWLESLGFVIESQAWQTFSKSALSAS